MAEVVLVGGGHAHVQVLDRFARSAAATPGLTLIVDEPLAVYSGMVPGFVAGHYRLAELEIDLARLARRAGARFVLAKAVGIDPEQRTIAIDNGPPIPYTIASFDIGATVAGLDLPGVRQHALAIRPISEFVRRIDRAVTHATAGTDILRAVVVGGGLGGLELAFGVEQRLRGMHRPIEVAVLEAGPRILAGWPETLVTRVRRNARARGIALHVDRTVVAVEPGAVNTADGRHLPYDLLVWVTGPASHPFFVRSGLSTDEHGFVLVGSTLAIEGHAELFAAGDCATMVDYPTTSKAGVYAVRQGPVLADNLVAAIGRGRLRSYTPQQQYLMLMNLGDGRAIGSKWGRAFEGRWVMRLKDWIDRRFVRRYAHDA